MEVMYRRDGEHNYMVLQAPEEVEGSEYQVRMLLVNDIAGLLRCKLRRIDGASYFYYEITSKQPLARILEHRAAGGEDIRAVAQAMSRTLEGISRYLLPDESLVLNPELIYMDVETREVSFCYLPCSREAISDTFRSLAEYLLKKLDHGDEQAVLWGYQIYSGTVEENYSISAVLRSLRGKEVKKKEIPEKGGAKPEKREPLEEKKTPAQWNMTGKERLRKRARKKKVLLVALGAAAGLAVEVALVFFHILTLTQAGGILFLAAAAAYYLCMGEKKSREEKAEKPEVKKRDKKAREKERKIRRSPQEKKQERTCPEEGPVFVEEGQKEEEEVYGQTTFLGGNVKSAQPVLISGSPELQKNMAIDKERFVIGKMKGQVDMVLNLPMISRIHAEIEKREGAYFLVDLNSTNGTFLNGERLEANEYRQLHTGDEICFAGAGYYFKE